MAKDDKEKIVTENLFLKKLNNELIGNLVKIRFNNVTSGNLEIEALKEKILDLEKEIVMTKKNRANQIKISIALKDNNEILSIKLAEKSDLEASYGNVLPIFISSGVNINKMLAVDSLKISSTDIPEIGNISKIFSKIDLMKVVYLLNKAKLELIKKDDLRWSKKMHLLINLINLNKGK